MEKEITLKEAMLMFPIQGRYLKLIWDNDSIGETLQEEEEYVGIWNESGDDVIIISRTFANEIKENNN